MEKIKLKQALMVEGRDDVRAVKEVCEALIIPTHGFGITPETWQIAEKAYLEKGLIILTDPDHAGEEIRRKLTARFPDAVQAYIDRKDADRGGDIGVENTKPEVIKESLEKALRLAGRKSDSVDNDKTFADINDLVELGLAAAEGAAERRAEVCKHLGIGYSNASSMIGRLRGFGIDIDELKKAAEKIK